MAQTGNSTEDEMSRESRGDIYLTVAEVAPYGEEPVEIISNDQVFYQAVDLMIRARLDSGVNMHHGPTGPGPISDHGGKEGDANKENEVKDDPMERKSKK